MCRPFGAPEALCFEGRAVVVEPGDTVASALYRAGVRTFSRSFKYHRRRGLYCLTGDCPNCLVSVDGEPCVRACVTPARAGIRVWRENGFPSVDTDVLSLAAWLRPLMPVGFYYKTMVRPRWLWPLAEPLVRRVAGLGTASLGRPPAERERRSVHPDTLVVGGGVAGLAAAVAAAHAGRSVLLCDEGTLGEKVAPGEVRARIDALAAEARAAGVEILERAPAIGIYEGPLVPLNAEDMLVLVHPEHVVVATGAVERHAVFPGSDLPGVWLARGAARMAGVHGVAPGRRVVVAGTTHEVEAHAATLRDAGAEVQVLDGVRAAAGRRMVDGAVLPSGERVACDAIVLALGLEPRDGLLRQAAGAGVVGAGDVVAPGCTLAEAEESGRRAALAATGAPVELPPLPLPPAPDAGIVCTCEDVSVSDLAVAWDEGFRSTEILKRYTTATMGPCQGALCQPYVRAFVCARSGTDSPAAGRTTARPPARPITLEEAAAGVRHEADRHTALHERHLTLGAVMEPAGAWFRPSHYGDPEAEYWAVRRDVSVMDVGTLGKVLVAGPDALAFLERLYPCHVADLEPGRLRYALLLADNGFVADDGLVCALGEGRYYLTFTSGGADSAEPWLRDWAETWQDEVYVVDQTSALGAINVAGPRARDLLARLTSDPVDNAALPYLRHRELEIAGVACRAIRLGFLGELSYELHHPSSRSAELWDALLAAGAELGVRPHGLEALRLLRLEKGHVIIGQDTDYDSTPAKLGMGWAVKEEKPAFVGKHALARIAATTMERRLVALAFDGRGPAEGAALSAGGRHVGHLTSARFSPVLGHGVALGWVTRVGGEFPAEVDADGLRGRAVAHAFYDPEGARLRA